MPAERKPLKLSRRQLLAAGAASIVSGPATGTPGRETLSETIGNPKLSPERKCQSTNVRRIRDRRRLALLDHPGRTTTFRVEGSGRRLGEVRRQLALWLRPSDEPCAEGRDSLDEDRRSSPTYPRRTTHRVRDRRTLDPRDRGAQSGVASTHTVAGFCARPKPLALALDLGNAVQRKH